MPSIAPLLERSYEVHWSSRHWCLNSFCVCSSSAQTLFGFKERLKWNKKESNHCNIVAGLHAASHCSVHGFRRIWKRTIKGKPTSCHILQGVSPNVKKKKKKNLHTCSDFVLKWYWIMSTWAVLEAHVKTTKTFIFSWIKRKRFLIYWKEDISSLAFLMSSLLIQCAQINTTIYPNKQKHYVSCRAAVQQIIKHY